MAPANIKVGNVRLGGQNPANGVTRVIDTAVQIGDLVTSDTVTPNKVIRGAAGAYPVGIVVTKEADGLGSVQSLHNVQIIPLTGSLILGAAALQTNGTGGGQLVAAGTANSFLVNVLGTQVVGGVTYVALCRL